jgi:anti-sigma28 factor (negative regulator of flagellin synthesis)
MDVRSISSTGGLAGVNRAETAPASEQAAPASPEAPADQVEISQLGRMLDDAARSAGVREQRLAQIKAAIEAGSYETPEKLQVALDRLLAQIDSPQR